MLPPPKTAKESKTRGKKTLADVMYERLGSESLGVADMWPATAPAAALAGRELLGQVNHNLNYRNPINGLHTNDIESEWARLKVWCVKKYAVVGARKPRGEESGREMMELHLYEYMYYTNVGRSFASVMHAFKYDAEH